MTVNAGILLGLLISLHFFVILLIWITSYRFNTLVDKLNILGELSRGINTIAKVLENIEKQTTQVSHKVDLLGVNLKNFKEHNAKEHLALAKGSNKKND